MISVHRSKLCGRYIGVEPKETFPFLSLSLLISIASVGDRASRQQRGLTWFAPVNSERPVRLVLAGWAGQPIHTDTGFYMNNVSSYNSVFLSYKSVSNIFLWTSNNTNQPTQQTASLKQTHANLQPFSFQILLVDAENDRSMLCLPGACVRCCTYNVLRTGMEITRTLQSLYVVRTMSQKDRDGVVGY